jgi:hypothetical protein
MYPPLYVRRGEGKQHQLYVPNGHMKNSTSVVCQKTLNFELLMSNDQDFTFFRFMAQIRTKAT